MVVIVCMFFGRSSLVNEGVVASLNFDLSSSSSLF